MKYLHIVRRYGKVGGMERYVWELSHAMASQGLDVTILCEHASESPASGIKVYELGEIMRKPGWISLIRFGHSVAKWLNLHAKDNFIAYSHEKIAIPGILVIHFQPFPAVFQKPWWQILSLRVLAHLLIERQALIKAKLVVPNSGMTRHQLSHYYPRLTSKLVEAIEPGVTSFHRPWLSVPDDGGIIGFVGREWKRKGLPFAAKIVAELRKKRPRLEFRVIGPAPTEVQHLFTSWNHIGYQLPGWQHNMDYLNEINILIHPAIQEPYGMVIAEAMSAAIPVVISEHCRVIDHISIEAGEIVSLEDPLSAWVDALHHQLQRKIQPKRWERSWNKVASQYVTLHNRHMNQHESYEGAALSEPSIMSVTSDINPKTYIENQTA